MTGSDALLGLRPASALSAERDPAKTADEADEGTAFGAGIPFGGPLFPAAGATDHGVVFMEFAHRCSRREVVALDLIDQRRARDAELDRCAGSIAGMMLESALDMLAFQVFQAQRGVSPIPDAGAGPELTR
jgi:hypothetical protein